MRISHSPNRGIIETGGISPWQTILTSNLSWMQSSTTRNMRSSWAEGLCQEPRGQPAVHIALEERTKRDRRPVACRGSGNYSSDAEKEIARLKRELRDATDALDVLKKAISILGK